MTQNDREARLARLLRGLRESHWDDTGMTQAQLAAAFSTEHQVAAATISAWESTSNTKFPNHDRLRAYARFFATRRSIEGEPKLIPESELDEAELTELRSLESRLLGQLGIEPDERPGTFTFANGPVTIICPEAPERLRGLLASERAPNFTKLQQYADLDALIEIHGHVRAANPSLDVFHRLASEADADDMQTHVIVLGGIVWNEASRRFQHALRKVPITQLRDPELGPDETVDPKLDIGEIFSVEHAGGDANLFRPVWAGEGEGDERELTEDVAYLARIPNPFNSRRTLTICNGVHSRGVLGAVRCLTDAQVRDGNEQYLADRFPDGQFALLLRVPVVTNKVLSPDLQTPDTRLFEWPPEDGVPA